MATAIPVEPPPLSPPGFAAAQPAPRRAAVPAAPPARPGPVIILHAHLLTQSGYWAKQGEYYAKAEHPRVPVLGCFLLENGYAVLSNELAGLDEPPAWLVDYAHLLDTLAAKANKDGVWPERLPPYKS